jgi:hypothetical protein
MATMPICDACWKEKYKTIEVGAIRNSKLELCCLCGEHTTNGVYFPVKEEQIKFK